MSERVRSIRFARVDVSSCRSNAAGETVIARVLLDEAPLPAGTIVSCNATWCYQLSDGLPSGLVSARSRQDLEQQIILFHFGAMPSVGPAEGDEPPLSLAM